MLRRVLIAGSTFAIVVLLFVVYQLSTDGPPVATTQPVAQPPVTTQLADDVPRLHLRGVDVPPGEKPFVIVYDEHGRPKIRFRSVEWRPIRENEWHMTAPEVRLLLPSGQPVYITADEGQVVVAREESDNYDPKQGWLKGNVHIVIDRTDERWRRLHPDRAEPEQHPEFIVKLWMDDVEFDLDSARLWSEGAVRVESSDATVEGTGLTLGWNEVDRRIDLLEIQQGKRMELRQDTALVEFAMPGSTQTQRVGSIDQARAQIAKARSGEPDAAAPLAMLNESSRATAASKPADRKDSVEDLFLDITKDSRFERRRDQIDTYRAVLEGGVAVRQTRGDEELGTLAAETLTLMFDFGEAQRQATDAAPDTTGETATSAPAVAAARSATSVVQTKIELTWSGKLTLVPETVDAGQPTGKRFHALASGNVHVRKADNEAHCDTLEFHNETEQVWLTGSPVRLRQGTDREMVGEKISYDRANGIAQIDGPGSMTGARELADAMRVRDESVPAPKRAGVAGDDDEKVLIEWTQGVALRFGTARRSSTDARTSEMLIEESEFLQHARFTGDVKMSQPRQSLEADDVELVFAEQASTGMPGDNLAALIANRITTEAGQRETIRAALAATLGRLLSSPREQQREVASELSTLLAELAPLRDDAKPAAEHLNALVGRLFSTDLPTQEVAAVELGAALAKLTAGDVAVSDADTLAFQKEIAGLLAADRPTTDVLGEQLDKMIARGRVRLRNQGKDAGEAGGVVTADELVVQMTVDADGDNVPLRADARGNVSAQLDEQVIRARDRIAIEFASVAAPLPPLEPAVAARVAADRKLDVETIQAARRDNREIDVVYLEAFDDVQATDPRGGLNLSAEALRCWMPNGGQAIERASVTGEAGSDAQVELNDFYVRGPSIEMDVKTQRAEVPAAGSLRLRTYKDLDGETLEDPIPVTISWSDSMVMEGRDNVAFFRGNVHAVSRSAQRRNVLDCQTLRMDFADIRTESQAATTAAGPSPLWIFEPLATAVRQPAKESGTPRLAPGMNKQPTYLLASDEARVLSTVIDSVNPQRIVSQMHLDGPSIAVDLVADSMKIDGAGHLLIEDRQLPGEGVGPKTLAAKLLSAAGRTPSNKAASSSKDTPFGASFAVQRPSQTLFTWRNAMSFFADRSLAVFDGDVTMTHVSGSQIKGAERMQLDLARLRELTGRRAGLRCRNLLVEFLQDSSAGASDSAVTPLGRATELRQFTATQDVRLEDGDRSVEGNLVTYNRTTNLVRVEGGVEAPAKFIEPDPKTGRLRVGHGDTFTYNVETGRIVAGPVTFLATGR